MPGPLTATTRVALDSQRIAPQLDRLSWDSLRMLLVLDEAGSFRSAASIAGVSLNTIRSKIDRLERQFGAPLLHRSVEGVRLTQDGFELVSIVREMRQLGMSTRRVTEGGRPRPRDVLRVTITEGLGTYWLLPKVAEFGEHNPNLRIQLTCAMAAPDVLFRDVDISIQMTPPANPDLIVERIAIMHVMPFASERYLRQFGAPASLADAHEHRLVWQAADQLPLEMLTMFIERDVAERIIVLQTNTSSAHFLAVANGTGIGLLPTYARMISKSVRPIDIGLNLHHDIFMVYHPDMQGHPEVQAGLEWLRSAFDSTENPWFGEEFIHPEEFDRSNGEAVVVNLFEGIGSS